MYMKIELTQLTDKIIMFVNLNDDTMKKYVETRNQMYNSMIDRSDDELDTLLSSLDASVDTWTKAIITCNNELEKLPYVKRDSHDSWAWPIDKLEEAEAFVTYLTIKSAQ